MIRKVITPSQATTIQRCYRKIHIPTTLNNATTTTTCQTQRIKSLSTLTHVQNNQNNNIANQKILSSNVAYFSSMQQSPNNNNEDDQVLIIPPNLKFDRRAVSTPIYGLEKIIDHDDDHSATIVNDDEEEEEKNDSIDTESNAMNTNNAEDEEASKTANSNDTVEIEDDDDDDDNDDELEIVANEDLQDTLYSLSDKPEPLYVTPLPQRLHVTIYDFMDTTEVGTMHLSSHVFGEDPIRTDILHRCVVYQRNKKRGLRNNGARTKTVSTKSGSGKKMRNQKGGGVARAGHKRAAHWRGGAKAHGPKGNDQNYETKLNKKVRMKGVRMALSQKLKEGNLIVVNGFEGLETYKTKTLAKLLEDVGDIGGRYGCSAYIIDHVPEDEEENEDGTLKGVNGVNINLQVASGNIVKVKVRNQKFVNVYDVLKHEKLLISLSAIEALEGRYGNE